MRGRILKRNEVGRRISSKVPLIGKIKIGEKRKNAKGKEFPTSLDYFVATGQYKPLFDAAYPHEGGNPPRKIQIIFPDNDIMKVCREEVEGRGAKDGKRYGYSDDGITYYLWDVRSQDYSPIDIEQDSQYFETFTQKYSVNWHHILHLFFVIPKIQGIVGQWQFSTKGQRSSMPQIIEVFDSMQESLGTVVNIPFDLQVEKVKSQKPGETWVFPVVKLIPNISTENMESLRLHLQTHTDFLKLGVIMTDDRITALASDSAVETKALPEVTESAIDVEPEPPRITPALANTFLQLTKRGIALGVLSGKKNVEAEHIIHTQKYNDAPLTDESLQEMNDKLEEFLQKNSGLSPQAQKWYCHIMKHGQDVERKNADAAKELGDEEQLENLFDAIEARLGREAEEPGKSQDSML